VFYLLITSIQRAGIHISGLRVLKYITVRSALALICAFVVGLLIGPKVIRKLLQMKVGQPILEVTGKDGVQLPDEHKRKKGTPIMGGIIILVALIVPVLLFCNLTDPLVLMLISMMVGFGMVGYRDDYLKFTEKNSRGISGKTKLMFQLLLGLLVGLFLKFRGEGIFYALTGDTGGTHVCFPFVKNWYPDLGWLFIPYAMFVVTATSNAANLTDGMDGLAIGTVIIVAVSLSIIGYLAGRPDYSQYLIIPYIPGAGELTVFLAAMVGASTAFLWFNANPAEIFMGDTGSLALGGLLGTIALFLKQEILLVIIGGIFVLEALSVIIQVASFKFRNKKRVFLMSPYHHHLQKVGLAEPKIITRFWIVAAILALAGLTTLKLR